MKWLLLQLHVARLPSQPSCRPTFQKKVKWKKTHGTDYATAPVDGGLDPSPPRSNIAACSTQKVERKEEGRGCGGGGVGYEARAVRVLHWISPGEKPEE